MITQVYTLDMVPGGRTLIIPASQYDSGYREFILNLEAGGNPYTIPDGAAVSVRGTTRSGRGFAYSCTYSGSAVSVQARRTMTGAPGDTWCELRIESADGENVIGSANFILRVEPTALSDTTDISATEIPAIEDAARKQAERAEAAAKRAEEAGGGGSAGVSPTVEMAPISGGTRLTITDKNGAHSTDIMNGTNGADGEPGAIGPAGADGAQGQAGADGVSPTVAFTAIDGGTRITITDASGAHSADIMNGADGKTGAQGPAGADGADGKPGADGVSPTVTTAQTETGAVITITDKTGAHTVTLANGKDGADGKPGAAGPAGADGVSPTVAVAQTDTGATITITDANGAHTATIANGKNGADGHAGADGKPGADGKNGADGAAATVTIGTVTTGAPGTSATVTNSGTANAAILNFTIPRGADGAAGPAGADGKPGATGPAYTLTDADKSAIVAAVLAQMTNAETEAL